MTYRGYSSLHQFLRDSAYKIKSPRHVFLHKREEEGYKSISYDEVFQELNAISAYLVNLGFAKGDRAGMMMDNCAEYLPYSQ